MKTNLSHNLLSEIEAFLSRTGMKPVYFGKAASGNSELVKRLRDGGRVWPETAEKVREFIANRTQGEPVKRGRRPSVEQVSP